MNKTDRENAKEKRLLLITVTLSLISNIINLVATVIMKLID